MTNRRKTVSHFNLTGAILLVLGTTLCCAAAGAEDSGFDDMFQFRAFGTLGLTHSDLRSADYVANNLSQPQGAGYSKDWSPDVDSKLAAQLDAKLTSRLSAVIQLISGSNYNSSWSGSANPRYRPSLEWANLKFQVTNEMSVRGGRLVLPMLLMSEYRKVGYAYHFVRPPIETYSETAVTNFDGGDLTFSRDFNGTINTFSAFDGGTAVRAAVRGTEGHLFGFCDTLETGPLTLHASYTNIEIHSADALFPPGFFTNFEEAAAGLPSAVGTDAAGEAQFLSDRYDLTAHWLRFHNYELGAIYDPGAWFAMAEVFAHRNDGLLGNLMSGWASGGYRYQKITPYATYARVRKVGASDAISLAGLPQALAGYAASINDFVGGINSGNTNSSQQSFSLGERWDVMKHLAVKGQYDRVDLDGGSHGLLVNIQPGFRPGANANVFSATLDFVFQ
ncbi:MAG TPA: hypothetical protein VIY90_19900 [Steroidobacteraceae bacterium]